MPRKTTIKIGDLSVRARPAQEDSIILLAVGELSAKMTYRTAGPTVIKGGKTQRDRGMEFDYPKPKSPAPKPRSRK